MKKVIRDDESEMSADVVSQKYYNTNNQNKIANNNNQNIITKNKSHD